MAEKQTDIRTQAAAKFHNQSMHIFHTESVYISGEKDHTQREMSPQSIYKCRNRKNTGSQRETKIQV